MILTEHFTSAEFEKSSTATRLGIDNSIPGPLLTNAMLVAKALEVIRAAYGGVAVKVTSGYRSSKLNVAVGGSKTSSHCNMLAVDFTVSGRENIQVCQDIPNILEDFDQVIYEFGPKPKGWIHLGLGGSRKQLLSAVKRNGKTTYLQGIVA